jgi:methylated-DNA-[protein]-cysteine S-methyltransferase
MITLASDGSSLVGLWIEGQKYHGTELFNEMARKDDLPVFMRTKEWLDRYFAGKRPSSSELPLSPMGSVFRQMVWKILCEIPYGKTVTYAEIARTVALKMDRNMMSAQAVGGAIGHNPISVIIPCHRVVGSDGNLTGYAGGLNVKKKLLEQEGTDMSALFVHSNGIK